MAAKSNGSNITNAFKILIAGGCYSGLAAAITILERCDTSSPPVPVEIVIVDERDGFYHVIGTPLALADKAYAEKAWVEFRHIKILQRPDVKFIHGSLQSISCDLLEATIIQGDTKILERYDFFVGATGLRRVWPVVPQGLNRVDYLAEAGKHIDAITKSSHPVLVIGGGAVGIEMAAELKICYPYIRVILAHSRDKLLSSEPLPDTFKDRSLKLLRDAGVEVMLKCRLVNNKTVAGGQEVDFSNGDRLTASVVIMAISRSVPSTTFLPKESLTEEGYVNVTPSLQLAATVPNSSVHFAAGDMINWSGIKRCGSAMHMGKLVGFNVCQLIQQKGSKAAKAPKLKELSNIPPMITVAIGKSAASYGPLGVKSGKRTMRLFFEQDLGFRIIWDYLRLGCEPGSLVTWKQSAANILVYLIPEARSVWTKLARS
ncbi:hypothetical protein JX266_009363 [Neoarthrinium moseri]|nr:hypothetical protein JX266_009363 [Neoarthrinium moseri]